MDDVPSPPPLWAVLAAAVAVVAAAAYVLYFQLGTVGLHALAVVVGALAVTALVALHYRQTALLARQAVLQRRQLRLDEERARPSAAVELGPVEVDGDELAVSLSNGGRVAVRELSLVVDSAFPDGAGFDGASATVPLRRAATDGGTLAPVRDRDTAPGRSADRDAESGALHPGETNQRFAAGPRLAFVAPDGTEHVASVGDALARLSRADAGRVAVRVALEHPDADGGTTRQYVTGGVATPDGDPRLADVLHDW
jgi:hypothetical protein